MVDDVEIELIDEPSELDDEQELSDEQEQTDEPSDELGFSFDDEPDADPEKEALRQEIRRLEKLASQHTQTNNAPSLRPKPTLFDFDYDEQAYEADLDKWYAEKTQVEQVQKEHQAKYQAYDERYIKSVEQMRQIAKDYDDIELKVADSLDDTKQALLKMAVDDVAKMAYFLGKSPKTLDTLAKTDPIAFVKQLGVLEEQMKKRNPNKPLPTNHTLAGKAQAVDTQLAKLEAEAERTGDRSKLVAYKRTLRK